jgi:hypothetical protein
MGYKYTCYFVCSDGSFFPSLSNSGVILHQNPQKETEIIVFGGLRDNNRCNDDLYVITASTPEG